MLANFYATLKSAVERAEVAVTSVKAARKFVQQVDALRATADELPDGYEVTLPTDAEVDALRALTSPSLYSDDEVHAADKLKAAAVLAGDVDLGVPADELDALLKRYSATRSSGGKGASGKSDSPARNMPGRLSATAPDGWVARSENPADWTSIRWRISEYAGKNGNSFATENLNECRDVMLKAAADEVEAEHALPMSGGDVFLVRFTPNS